jgi:tetratricopeptide (TPR) repeat protein
MKKGKKFLVFTVVTVAIWLMTNALVTVHADDERASDYAEQLRDLDKALQINEFYKFGQNLFWSSLQEGMERGAQAQKTRNDALAFMQSGFTCLDKKDWNGAINNFTKAVNTDATLAMAYKGRGIAYYAKGDNDRALADYDSALLFDAADAQLYDMRANVYFQKGDYDRALKDYNYSIRINPANALSYYNRGNAYCQKGDNARGHADFTAALRINPEMKEARNALDLLNKKGL